MMKLLPIGLTLLDFSYNFCLSSLFISSFFAVVATDDEKIAECCRGFGADVVITSAECRNGSFFVFFVYFNP